MSNQTNIQNSNDSKKVVINLTESVYPHAFKDKSRIHQQEYERAINLINEQYLRSKTQPKKGNPAYVSPLSNRIHDTISVFGGRGTGKTSFLHSILDNYFQDDSKDIEVLGIIDPTILEEKGHPFLYIISLINEHVLRYLDTKYSEQDSAAILLKRQWKNDLLKLAKGLPSLESIGPDYRNTNWQDNDFIMEKGLEQVNCALKLEELFHKLVDRALQIINKDVFMLAFDDIDVNIKKGWPILECIRKYLTTPKIITLLSGNLKFYSNNIRIHQWEQLATLVKYEALGGTNQEMMDKLTSQVNEIEGQYLLKLLKAENRVHLNSIYDAINTYKWKYYIKDDADRPETELKEKYKEILDGYGIFNKGSRSIFINYLISLSVRTQINFLRNNIDVKDSRNFKAIDTFISRMYASKIDVDLMLNTPRMSNAMILNYLLRYDILHEAYLLLPTNDDENINGCMTGLSFIMTEKISKDPFIIFDYILRIGYIRNILLITSNSENFDIKKMCQFSGAFKDISLKNFMGLTMGYLASFNENFLKEHTSIYGLASRRKKKKDDVSIDTILNQKEATAVQRIICLLPLCALKNINTNGSKLYYSIFNLLASIGQIIKVGEDKNRIISELQSLQLLRYYPMRRDVMQSEPSSEVLDLSDETEKKDYDLVLNTLADNLMNWINSYNQEKSSSHNESADDNATNCLPPYALGRIATRLFSVVSQIKQDNLGDIMHRNVVALLNACLIDEAREVFGKGINESEYGDLIKLHYSNAVNSDKVFTDNLTIIKEVGWEHFKFTKWLLECPLIYAFIDPHLIKNSKYFPKDIQYHDSISIFSVYEILKMCDVKKPKQSSKARSKKSDSQRKKNPDALEEAEKN